MTVVVVVVLRLFVISIPGIFAVIAVKSKEVVVSSLFCPKLSTVEPALIT